MDTRTDNPQSQMEKAEGSRGNVNSGQPEPPESERMERGAGQVSQPEKPIHPNDGDNAGGITNRPLGEEEQKQRELPPRGHSKNDQPSKNE